MSAPILRSFEVLSPSWVFPPRGMTHKVVTLNKTSSLKTTGGGASRSPCRVFLRTERHSFASPHSLFPASAGGHLSPALSMICPRKKRVEKLLRFPTLFFLQRRGRRLRAEWGSAPHPAGASPRPRQGYRALDRGTRFAVWFTALFSPAANLSFFLHSVACGGVGCRGTPLLTSLSAYSASPFQK